jgi:hypothetical protein
VIIVWTFAGDQQLLREHTWEMFMDRMASSKPWVIDADEFGFNTRILVVLLTKLVAIVSLDWTRNTLKGKRMLDVL